MSTTAAAGPGDWWNLELEKKPDFELAMQRIYAWYEGAIIDRAPVRFSAHNADFNVLDEGAWPRERLKERWFNAEYQVDRYLASIAGKLFLGETFPVFWPNLGPVVYSAFYGAELEYGEVTAWAKTPLVRTWDDMASLRLSKENVYFKKLEELTRHALERCQGRFMVGYSDLHPGVDCAAAWRGTEQLCLDLYDEPEQAKKLIDLAIADFQEVYDHFDRLLKAHRQLSVSWMGIPSFGKMHIPSCDFSSLISTDFFVEFCLPVLRQEVAPMTHNIFHIDGKGVARHLDVILEVPGIQACQWVQGVGDDQPILQWLPLIKRLQAAGKSLVVDLQVNELDDFMAQVSPEGILLCLATESEEQERALLKRIERWR